MWSFSCLVDLLFITTFCTAVNMNVHLCGHWTRRQTDTRIHRPNWYTDFWRTVRHCRRWFVGPILWGHSGPLCHALSLSWTLMRRRRATVATPGEWQCGVQRLAVANGPNIFQMLLVQKSSLVPGPSAAPTTSTVFYCITALQPQTTCPLSTVTWTSNATFGLQFSNTHVI